MERIVLGTPRPHFHKTPAFLLHPGDLDFILCDGHEVRKVGKKINCSKRSLWLIGTVLMSKQIQGMENVKRCPVAELNCLAFLNLKHTEKKKKSPSTNPPPPKPNQSPQITCFYSTVLDVRFECGQTLSIYPEFYKYLQSSMPNIFVLSPKEHSQHSKAPFSWMVSVHWQFKGIQASKLGQLKRCLFLNIIISFWVSQIMIQVFRAKPFSREESMLYQEEEKFILAV